MQQYDYIITGSGASGLMLAYRMAKDTFFDTKSILIIDKETKSSNDRTWCYWEEHDDEWEDLVCQSWNKIIFNSDLYKKEIALLPYSYKMIRSAEFYEKLSNFIATKNHIVFLKDSVIHISTLADGAMVCTPNKEYKTHKLINSIDFNKKYHQQHTYPVLLQHFVGWFIETEEDVFDASVATFMDFTVSQEGKTRFMYVLPLSSRKALFEFTLFSKEVLCSIAAYENEIHKYLKNRSIKDYIITEKEQGVIPMTSYKFWKENTKNILHIGTVGGWTKASTGYTFKNTTDKTKEVIHFLKTETNFVNFRNKTRFWFYDLLLLDVLSTHNHLGATLFSKLFQRNSLKNVFRFLDEKTNVIDDLKIMLSMPPMKFVLALFKRVFNF